MCKFVIQFLQAIWTITEFTFLAVNRENDDIATNEKQMSQLTTELKLN